MSFDTRKKEMNSYFNTNFSGVASAQIIWDGVKPSDSLNRDNPHIAVSIQPVDAKFASLNSTRRVRHVGLYVVQIFIKPDETTEAADDIAQAVADAIEGKTTTNGIVFGASRITRVGLNDGIFQLNVFTDYKYDEQRS